MAGVEGASDLQGDDAGTSRGSLREGGELIERAGGHDLSGPIDIGGGEAGSSDGGEHLVLVAAEHGAHPGGGHRRGLRHPATAQGDEGHRLGLGEHTGQCGGRDLADRVASQDRVGGDVDALVEV